MEKHSDERRTDLWGNADNFVNTMNHFMASMLTPSLQVAMNELSNHDHSRFLTRTNHIVGRVAQLGSKAAEEGINLAVMREAVAVQMTWVGAPTVYYGDEAGVCGFTDPDSRRTYPWGQENRELVEFHKEMIRIHKREKPLRTGSLKMLSWSSNVLAYARFQEGEQIIVVLNNSVNTMNHFMASMLTPSLQVAMNELSNHDHSRFLTRTNHIVGRVAQLGRKAAEEGINLEVMREAVAVQMTWVGAPTVYYGDEAGVCGFTDPDSRRTYPWGRENRELVEFNKEMIRIHKREKPLRTGSLKMLSWSSNVLAYARFQEGEQIIVVLNNSKELKEVTIPVWQAEVPMKGKMERLMYSWEKSYTTERDIYLVEDGETVVNMGKHSVLIMKPVREMQVDEYGKESSSN